MCKHTLLNNALWRFSKMPYFLELSLTIRYEIINDVLRRSMVSCRHKPRDMIFKKFLLCLYFNSRKCQEQTWRSPVGWNALTEKKFSSVTVILSVIQWFLYFFFFTSRHKTKIKNSNKPYPVEKVASTLNHSRSLKFFLKKKYFKLYLQLQITTYKRGCLRTFKK